MKQFTRMAGLTMAVLITLTACAGPAEQPGRTEQTVTVSSEESPENLRNTVFTDLTQLSQSLNREIREGNRNPEFQYRGTEKPDAALFAQMTCSLYVRCDQKGDRYRLECMPYPGDRMVEAWKNGTENSLNRDEKAALEQAVQIVEQAKKDHPEPLELELALHDWLCDHIVYNDSTTEIRNPENPPRYLTALGALLDGDANCQGYTDGFYVLASLAGFQTDRMSVSGGGIDHIVNTIELDGSWYVVDATYDDFNDEIKEIKNHRLFNAGKDLCQEYSWEPWMEYRPVAAVSDSHYFYNLPEYPRTFDQTEALGESVLRQYRENGRAEQELVLRGQIVRKRDLDTVLENLTAGEPEKLQYDLFCTGRGENTYIYIRFAE